MMRRECVCAYANCFDCRHALTRAEKKELKFAACGDEGERAVEDVMAHK